MNKLDFSEIFRLYPPVLKEDKDFNAIGVALTIQLLKNAELAGREIIYPEIDKLPEDVLDALAYDFNVEWYDYEGTLEEKRGAIAGCMNIHKSKGTKGAILTALKSVYDDVQVQEWYEYGGEPFHFKITIKHSHSGFEKLTRLLEKVKYYKNARSFLDETVFEMDMSPPPATAYFGVWAQSETRETGAVLHYDLS